ncbi:hypothetical protein Misp02_47840 [Microtetraspora sp. NBRC 16547]|nr:hypothetical protein Misp02_47840 [Microtetraspora sp. NBRC 16547]
MRVTEQLHQGDDPVEGGREIPLDSPAHDGLFDLSILHASTLLSARMTTVPEDDAPKAARIRRQNRDVKMTAREIVPGVEASATPALECARMGPFQRQIGSGGCRSRAGGDEFNLEAVPVLKIGGVVLISPRIGMPVGEQQRPAVRRRLLSWRWLLEALGYSLFQEWAEGRSWRLGQAGSSAGWCP